MRYYKLIGLTLRTSRFHAFRQSNYSVCIDYYYYNRPVMTNFRSYHCHYSVLGGLHWKGYTKIYPLRTIANFLVYYSCNYKLQLLSLIANHVALTSYYISESLRHRPAPFINNNKKNLGAARGRINIGVWFSVQPACLGPTTKRSQAKRVPPSRRWNNE